MNPWWAVTLTRSMIATERASSFLGSVRGPLEACSEACTELENALNGLIDEPTPEGWDFVIEGVHRYFSASQSALESVSHANENQLRTFLEEIRKLQPLIKDHIERGAPVEVLPQTSVLFREMSGFPMVAWVLWRPEPPPLTPFQSPKGEPGDNENRHASRHGLNS